MPLASRRAHRRELARDEPARRLVGRALHAREHRYAGGSKGALRARPDAAAHHGLHRMLHKPESQILVAHTGGVQHLGGRHRAVRHGVDLELRALSEVLEDLVLRV